MGPINCLVTHILQNIFCFQQKNEIHISLEQLKGEFSFLAELSL